MPSNWVPPIYCKRSNTKTFHCPITMIWESRIKAIRTFNATTTTHSPLSPSMRHQRMQWTIAVVVRVLRRNQQKTVQQIIQASLISGLLITQYEISRTKPTNIRWKCFFGNVCARASTARFCADIQIFKSSVRENKTRTNSEMCILCQIYYFLYFMWN